ncbi:hypothetical protein F511_13931 [Dorcoceras hygrometricum]|uniref:Uncharacterized protein n=1 Tax=Dorcoceras hygrometricum TaxID=472368 RepID=A0A2Z7AX58_9LAMI|nr:hypothetical protein F511_13931 [Dorcoceras hygrometricum]
MVITWIVVFFKSTNPSSESTIILTGPSMNVLSTAEMWRHVIVVFFRNANSSSGPDISYTRSYTSILRLGLTAGDTPDAPRYHLGTREPSCTLQIPTYTKGSGALSGDLRRELGRITRGECHASKSPASLLLYQGSKSHRESRR